MYLDEQDRIDFIKTEMGLLQGRFDKYDNIIFHNRSIMFTIVVALVGAMITLKSSCLFPIALSTPVIFYILEVVCRWEYWYKYVIRYEYLRDALHEETPLSQITLFDLTHHYGVQPRFKEKFYSCVLKKEPLLFYLISFIVLLFLGFLYVLSQLASAIIV